VVVPHLMPLVTFVALIQLMDNFRVFEPIVGFNAGPCDLAVLDHLQRSGGETRQLSTRPRPHR
jgi:ABC-type sugar transport system permease subunit